MKYLKTQEDTEKKRNEQRSEDIPRAERSFDLATSGKLGPSKDNSSTPIETTKKSIENFTNFDNNLETDKLPNNQGLTDTEVIPDKIGHKSVATQTVEIDICRFCCTCKILYLINRMLNV